MTHQRLVGSLIVLTALSLPARADVGDPQVRTDHPWYPGELACSTFERLFQTQAECYRRVVGALPRTEEEKALAAWLWRNATIFHVQEAHQPLCDRDINDPLNTPREYWSGLFGHGSMLCGTTHSQWAAEMEALLGHARARTVGVDGHTSFEVYLTGGPYGAGKWVLLDHDISTVVYNREGNALLSIADIKADLRLASRGFAPERQHGWLVSGLYADDAPGVYTRFDSVRYLAGYAGPPPMVHLRRGESLRRYVQPGLDDGHTYVFWGTNRNQGGIPGPERDRTWVNQPDKMHGSREGTPARVGQARYGNAVYTYRPDFATADYREGILDESDRHVTFEFNTPYLIGGTPANLDKLFGVYDPGAKNGLVLHGKASCPVAVSIDGGRTWQDRGAFRDGLDLTDLVKGRQQYWIRFGTGARQLAGTGLAMVTVCQANTALVPHLKDGGSTVQFAASGQAVTTTGPAAAQARPHVVEGGLDTPQVTLEWRTPRQEPIAAVHAAAYVASGSPPQPDVRYQIDYSTDGGRTWQPVVKDWSIPRRGHEPNDFGAQSFCYGSAAVAEEDAKAVRVRFRNTGGKPYLRAEVALVYRTQSKDATKVTFDWTDDAGPHRDAHVFGAQGAPWSIATGKEVRTRWVEFEPVAGQ